MTATLPDVRHIAISRDLALACRVVGNGDVPVIFIHGYSMSLDCWDRALGFLPARYRAYAYDLRGFGGSGRPGRYALDDHAADLVALLDALGLKSVALIGHSLGSHIAQMVATAHPERARALVLANGRGLNLPAPDPVAGLVEERVKSYGTRDDNRRVLRERMTTYFERTNLAPGEMEMFVEIGARADTEALRQTLRGLYSFAPLGAAAFARVRAPTLIVTGQLDRMTPIEVCRPARDVLPQAEVEIIADAGHTPMWEKPAAWSARVFGFLDRSM